MPRENLPRGLWNKQTKFTYHIISFFISIPKHIHQKEKVTYNIKHIYNNKQDGNGGEGWKAKKA